MKFKQVGASIPPPVFPGGISEGGGESFVPGSELPFQGRHGARCPQTSLAWPSDLVSEVWDSEGGGPAGVRVRRKAAENSRWGPLVGSWPLSPE
jgi:hypothetical protein